MKKDKKDKKEYFKNVDKSKDRLIGLTNEATGGADMFLLLNENYDKEVLDMMKEYYSNYVSEKEHQEEFNKTLDAIFNTKFNTKTKKSDLYRYLNNYLINIELLTYQYPTDKYLTLADELEKTNTNLSFNVDQFIIDISMLGRNLSNSIHFKMVCKYKHLLPKRYTTAFKNNYRWLFKAIETYNTIQANRVANDRYIQIHNNEGISDVVQNLHLCNEITEDDYKNFEVKYLTEKDTLIDLDVDTGEGINFFDIAKQVESLIGATQSQLIVYIMSLVFEQNKDKGNKIENYWKVDIDVKEYCKLKGINFEERVADNIFEDIKNLQKIIIQYEYTNAKGKKDTLKRSSLFSNRGILTSYGTDNVTIEKQVVGVALGKWIETLRVDQFQFISKAFFKYKLRNQAGKIIPISYYINCQHRNNFTKSKSDEFKIKVGRLTTKLGIDEDRIKNKGYTSTLKKPLENILNQIKDAEGFDWKYKNGNHNSRQEFEEDVIIFKNNSLDELYINKGLTKKNKK